MAGNAGDSIFIENHLSRKADLRAQLLVSCRQFCIGRTEIVVATKGTMRNLAESRMIFVGVIMAGNTLN